MYLNLRNTAQVLMMCVFLLAGTVVPAQKIEVIGLGRDSLIWKKYVSEMVAADNPDTFALFAPCQRIIDTLQACGYYTAAVDSITIHDGKAQIYFYQGRKFNVRALIIMPYLDRQQVDTITIPYKDTISTRKRIRMEQQKMIETAILKGFPFAATRMAPVTIDSQSVDMLLTLLPGDLYTVGGLHVVGDLKISDFYLEQMLGLRIGTPYFPLLADKAGNKIRELTFAEQYKSPAVVFAEKKAWLALFLKKKNVNRFDLLIGFQPNTSNIPGVSSKFLLTGNATIELLNQFGKGEKLLGEYFQPSPMQQQLRLEGEYPFLLSTPLGVKGSFKLFRSDSSFIEKIIEFGGQYYFGYDSKLEAFWKRQVSDINTVDTQKIITTKSLPASLDYRTDYFGLTYNIQHLDFRLNPRKGFSVDVQMGIGQRRIFKNDRILAIKGTNPSDFNYSSLYDTVTLRSILFRPVVDSKVFFPLFKRMAIMIRANGAMIAGPKQVYNNEKFRIGGNKTFRGFNEQSIYTTSYLIATTEVKMVLDELSALFIFADNGWINSTSAIRLNNYLWNMGIGAGINFGTKIGVFGLSIAVGKNKSTPFDLQAAKIHFGYQSLF